MQALRVPCVPTAASQALHQLPATCACLAGATMTRTLPRHALSAPAVSTARSQDELAPAMIASPVATRLHPQTRTKIAAKHAHPASTQATGRWCASYVPLAQPMLMETQALRAAPARTARTQAVVEQHAARVSGVRSTQTQILRLRVLSARPGSTGRMANSSLNHTNRMHASQCA